MTIKIWEYSQQTPDISQLLIHDTLIFFIADVNRAAHWLTGWQRGDSGVV